MTETDFNQKHATVTTDGGDEVTVLVTGSSGFIGSHLLDYLLSETDDEVHVFDDLSTETVNNVVYPESSTEQRYFS